MQFSPNYQFPQLITCLNDSPGLVEGLLLNSPWMSPLKKQNFILNKKSNYYIFR